MKSLRDLADQKLTLAVMRKGRTKAPQRRGKLRADAYSPGTDMLGLIGLSCHGHTTSGIRAL